MRRSLAAVAMTAALAASMVVFSTGPAFAGACTGNATNAPDARLRDPAGNWSGGGEYPTVADGVNLGPGQSATFGVQWRNMAITTQTIRVRNLSFETFPGMKIRIFLDGTKITQKFRDGAKGVSFANVAAGKRTGIIEIRFVNTNPVESPLGRQNLYGHYKGSSSINCDAAFTSVNAP
jgi:hypothetical protein